MIRSVVGVCLFGLVGALCPASLAAEGPTVEEHDKSLRVRNAHYAVDVSRTKGGMVARLGDAAGRCLVDRFEIYTDVGLYEGRRYYGSKLEAWPRVAHTERDGKVIMVSEGRLLRASEEKPDYPLVRYEVKLTFDATAAIRVAITIESELTVKPERAFIAHILGLPDAPELFANTADGLLCQDAAARPARTWQSAHDPLDAKRPFFGVSTKRGTCVVLTDIRSAAGLANVFVHESGTQSLAAFFAWRDGPSPSPILKGQKLDLAYTLRILNGPDDLRSLLTGPAVKRAR